MRLSSRNPEFEFHPEKDQDLKSKVKAKAEKDDVTTTNVMFFIKENLKLFRKSLR